VLHEKTTLSDRAILQGLNANSQIRNRIASLLAVAQDASGDLKLADAAEMRLIEEIRCMGQEAMQAWADKQVQECEQEVRLSGQWHCDGKKNQLAHHLWRHQRDGAAIPKANQTHTTVRAKRQGQQSGLFNCSTAGGHRLWSRPANSAGFDSKTYVHGVGDGAPWIADQVEDQFGSQGHYLLDSFHVCEYLSAAGKAIHSDAASQDAWIDGQKVRLKTGRSKEFLQDLLPHLEDARVADAYASVRQCHRYLSNRQGAIQTDVTNIKRPDWNAQPNTRPHSTLDGSVSLSCFTLLVMTSWVDWMSLKLAR
jgi:hypothetical protein